MKTIIDICKVVILVTIVFWMISSPKPLKDIQTNIEEMENSLNTEVILNNDTLIVVDYSIIHETYILSNGLSIHRNMLEILKVKEDNGKN